MATHSSIPAHEIPWTEEHGEDHSGGRHRELYFFKLNLFILIRG